jgi:iron complex outermembrane receptor protein
MAPSTEQNAFWCFNASARVVRHDGGETFSVIGRNLTNRNYLLYAADRTGCTGVLLTIGEQRAVVARGREIAAQAAFKF